MPPKLALKRRLNIALVMLGANVWHSEGKWVAAVSGPPYLFATGESKGEALRKLEGLVEDMLLAVE